MESNYAYYPVVIEDAFGMSRDALAEKLAREEIFVRKYFYPIVTEFACYRGEFSSEKVPVALDVSRRVLSLPLYDAMGVEDVERVIQAILA